MRIDNESFSRLNSEQAREPRIVFEVDFGGEDITYLTSHAVTGLSGANVVDGVLVSASGTSQKLNPDKANAEIGAITFKVADDGLTDLQRDKLESGKGLRGKTVKMYVGWASLDWAEFILAQTQIVESVAYKDLEYTFKCADIQRALRKDIFDAKETRLARSLSADADEMEVYTTNGFQLVQQPDSPTGRTLAPGEKIGLLMIESGGEKEISLYTGIEDFKFTGLRRGVLGTRPLAVNVASDSDRDSAPKVTEFVYLEMPAPMLAYALLTGSIYGYPGEELPGHWHLGVAPEFIRTSEFTGIGADLWDLGDFDAGLPARVVGAEKEDGKKYIEEQIYRMMGCYAPVYSDGQIGLRRMTGVLSEGGYVRLLDEDNVVDYGDLTHDMKALANQVIVSWNYDYLQDALTRTFILQDGDSIETHGEADPLEVELYALSASRVSSPTIKNVTDALRDRCAGPPLRLSPTLSPDQNDLEVGDIVRVNLNQVRDYTGTLVDGHLERNFEIQRRQTDWVTGRVKVDLFGSSQKASELPPDEYGAAIISEWYSSAGTEISGANFPGVVSDNGITRITQDITLAGGATLADGVFWCGEDLTIDGGVTVTITGNIQLRVRGFLQINGEIDGAGNGLPGGVGVTATQSVGGFEGYLISQWGPENQGAPGYLFSSAVPQTGMRMFIDAGNAGTGRWSAEHSEGEKQAGRVRAGGQYSGAPSLSLDVTETGLSGLPIDLRGSGGSGGGALTYLYQTTTSNGTSVDVDYEFGKLIDGADGGTGGAGLLVVSRGFAIGAVGVIDVSGAPGAQGSSWVPADNGWSEQTSNDVLAYSGAGAGGGPGAAYFIMDGADATPGNLTDTNLLAYIAEAPYQGSRVSNGRGNLDVPWYRFEFDGNVQNGVSSIYAKAIGRSENAYQYASRIQILTGRVAEQPDQPPETDNPVSITLQEVTNTPRSANANLSTIEVSATPPDATNYSYALIEYREQGQDGWFEVGPASPEVTFVVPSDGKTYEVQARGVSISGKVNPDGAIAAITTTRVRTPQPGDIDDEPEEGPEADPDDVVPAPPVTGLELFEQGNDPVFGGRDAKFSWRKTSVTEWFEMGQEGTQGASSGGLDLYFRDYQVEVWADVGGTLSLVRTEWVTDPQFVYTYEKNAEDHARETASVGAWRAFEVRVYCRGRQNQISPQAARLSVENVAPPLPTFLVSAGFRSIQLNFDVPEDLDYRELRVWMSQTSGFETAPGNLVAQQYGGPVVLSGLSDGVAYFLRLATYDAFGQGELSAELPVTTDTLAIGDVSDLQEQLNQQAQALLDEVSNREAAIQQEATERQTEDEALAQQITTLGGAVGDNAAAIQQEQTARADADEALAQDITTVAAQADDNLAAIQQEATARADADGVLAQDITSLSTTVDDNTASITEQATSIDGLEAKWVLSVNANGVVTGIELASGQNGSSMVLQADQFAFRGDDDSDIVPFTVAGSVLTFQGAISITSGSGYANLSDIPVSLADINTTEGNKLGGVEDGATAGADWVSNLSNIPDRLGDTPTTGLNLTATHLGYYDEAAWLAFIDSDGDFYFGDGDRQYIKKEDGEISIGEETDFLGFANFNSLDYSRYIVTHVEQEYSALADSGSSVSFINDSDPDYGFAPGGIRLQIGVGSTDQVARVQPDVGDLSFQSSTTFESRLSFEVMVRFLGPATSEADFFIGKGSVHGGILDAIGFRYYEKSPGDGAKLHAWSSIGLPTRAFTATELAQDISFNTRLGLRQYSDRIEYYVDRSLVATITTNLPEPTAVSGVRFPSASVYVPTTASQDHTLYMGEARFLQKDPAVFNA